MAKLNEFGEVEMAIDPFAEIPSELARVLTEFVLLSDWEQASYRLDALQLFVSEFDDNEDESSANEWIEQRRGQDFVVYLDDDGSFISSATARVHVSLPVDVVDRLLDLFSAGEIEMTAGVAALEEIFGEWSALLTDDEKLVGHLVRTHGADVTANADSDALIALHAKLHKS